MSKRGMIRERWSTASKRLKLGLMLLVIAIANLVWLPIHTHALPTHMMVFWDPSYGSVPTGWTVITTYNGDFPRGEAPANFGATGGATTPYTPTVASITVSAPDAADIVPAPGTGTTGSSDNHTHPNPTVTVGADSNSDIPAFRSLQLIEYSTGIPTFLPAGAIVMFDTNGAIPGSGFTQITAQNNLMLRVNSTVATGGTDTANNSVAVGALPNTTDTGFAMKVQGGSTNLTAQITHGHLAPAAGNTTAVSTLPPYVQPQLAQATANTTTIPTAVVCMFDGDPGGGWQVVSNSGGAYYQQFLRPAATASLTSQGATTHTPPTYTVNSGAVNTSAGPNTKSNGNGTGVALQTHYHTITVNFNSTSNLPPYFNVVLAQKISFTLQAYGWYVESGSQNVTDPWPTGTLNLAQNTMLPAIPAAYQPPDTNGQLRLRVQILVSGSALPASSDQFKLQWKQGTDGSCTSGSWTDVGTGAWVYGTNAVADGTSLTASVLTPASSVLETFVKTASSPVNPNAASVGQTMEYDFLIKNASAASGSQYSIRVVEVNSSQPMTAYTTCPTLVTMPGVNQEMRHGKFFQDGVKQGFEWAN